MRALLANVVYMLIVVLKAKQTGQQVVKSCAFPCPYSNSYATPLRNRLRFHLRLRLRLF